MTVADVLRAPVLRFCVRCFEQTNLEIWASPYRGGHSRLLLMKIGVQVFTHRDRRWSMDGLACDAIPLSRQPLETRSKSYNVRPRVVVKRSSSDDLTTTPMSVDT